jgi:hypothetical protein
MRMQPAAQLPADLHFLFIYFCYLKIVVVDKGKPALWTAPFFPCATRTCESHTVVCAPASGLHRKWNNIAEAVPAVDKTRLVPKLSPELSDTWWTLASWRLAQFAALKNKKAGHL